MANVFFPFLDGHASIEHAKISVKFDNFNEGNARVSFRIISSLSKISNNPGLYLLIKNDENPVRLEEINSEYNAFLDTEQFRKVAGAYGLEPTKNFTHCSIFTIERFPENPKIEGSIAIHPKQINCRRIKYGDIPKQLKNILCKRDILLKIDVNNVMEVLQEAFDTFGKHVWIFQFRIFLGNFVPEETLKCWKSSSRSWSIDFCIHQQRNYENLFNSLHQIKALRYPKSVELWFTIPHKHQFVASSPVYEKAFRLKLEDVYYKTYSLKEKAKEMKKFESKDGDYAVKIMNTSGEPKEFSIICISPFLPGQEPEKLRRDIDEFQKEKESFIKWENMITPLTLLVGILALVFGIINVFIVRMTGSTEIAGNIGVLPDLLTIIISAVFFGLGVWGVAMPVHLLFSNRLKWEMCPSDKCFAVSTIIVVLMLTITFFYFLISN